MERGRSAESGGGVSVSQASLPPFREGRVDPLHLAGGEQVHAAVERVVHEVVHRVEPGSAAQVSRVVVAAEAGLGLGRGVGDEVALAAAAPWKVW